MVQEDDKTRNVILPYSQAIIADFPYLFPSEMMIWEH